MFLLFTDFGWQGPYVGQVKAVLAARCPTQPIIDLMHDAAVFRPREAGYLLAAIAHWIKPAAVVVAVVDPGVGTERRAIAAALDGRWFVGPDNGLLAPTINAAADRRVFALPMPEGVSASFHGRDVFAPAAAELAVCGRIADQREIVDWVGRDLPADTDQIVYIDGYGNVLTGRRAATLPSGMSPAVAGQPIAGARTFADVAPGDAFWYRNSLGLVEIAVNQGNAARRFGLEVGDWLRFQAIT
ncbi:MAG: SAM-dependent chlorinase/fluorinase [Nitrococcus mobilis]|nr:SAM-dependent chlorinase/fluorinase [Nitrococcus mobilis]